MPLALRKSATATELVLELLYPTCGIDKALFTRVSRVGICSHIADNYMILDAIDCLQLFGFNRRTRKELSTG